MDTEEEVVVITDYGFMTSKLKKDVLDTDEQLYTGTPRNCNNFIHSIPLKDEDETD